MPIDLQHTAEEVAHRLSALDFAQLWPGFHPYRFALYDEDTVFFNGTFFSRTADFVGNTAIVYQGEPIAIWNLEEVPDINVLSAKIVHEMFHAFQQECGEKRFANEFEAILKYQNCVELLALRCEENRILSSLCAAFNETAFTRLLSLRKLRMQQYPYEYTYESSIEAIEGAAQFVELSTLRALNAKKHAQALARLQARLSSVDSLLPARIACYDSGAAMLLACAAGGLMLPRSLGEETAVFYQALIKSTPLPGHAVPVSDAVAEYFEADQTALQARFARAFQHPLSFPADTLVKCFNVYGPRRLGPHILSEYFLMIQAPDAALTVLNGDFVFRMDDLGRLAELYQII
ncbi:MAG: hypothetical protein PUD73_04230 [bacterium]|nr:hypothetical protein [bacterium]